MCYDIPDGGDILNIDDWRSQLKRGTLEFCILLMIQKGECYGYEMISRLEKSPILAAKESTIYPLLRRGFWPPIGGTRRRDCRRENTTP